MNLLACLAMNLIIAMADSPARPDIVLADFEGPDFGGWTVKGDAFGTAPARGTLPGQQPVSGFQGKGLANSFHGGDGPTGELLSPVFEISRNYIRLLVGGGEHPGKTAVELRIDGKLVRSETGTASTGADDEHLSLRVWDVREFQGRLAQLAIVDRHRQGWGHINVDDIVLTDRKSEISSDNPQVARAMTSVAGAQARAEADPGRPAFHLLPPSLWINDPNGTIHHDGWYHIFYQHNPYGDRWEHMHWGHARSRDLVTWQHLPIALWPSRERGEQHCFSGCAAHAADGSVVLLYTSIGARAPEQWAAEPLDRELIKWKKTPDNPILTLKSHGSVAIDDWRDPFVFEHQGRKWMVVGGHPRGGRGGICLYEAENGALTKWRFAGVAFQGSEPNWECPNLIPIRDRFLLLYSPHGPVRYHAGRLDTSKPLFTSERAGLVDGGDAYYATNLLTTPDGRTILLAWLRGFAGGKGWNGCISLPREVDLAADGHLIQRPARELAALRAGDPVVVDSPSVGAVKGVDSMEIGAMEIELALAVGATPRGVRLVPDSGEPVAITVDSRGLLVGKEKAPWAGNPPKEARLRIFTDRTVIEVFANEEACLTKTLHSPIGKGRVELIGETDENPFGTLRAWSLRLPKKP